MKLHYILSTKTIATLHVSEFFLPLTETLIMLSRPVIDN